MKRLFTLLKEKNQIIISTTALAMVVMVALTIPQLSLVLGRYANTMENSSAMVRAGIFDVVASSRDYIGQGNWSDANLIQLAQAGPTVTMFELPLFDVAYSTNDGLGGFPTVIGSNFLEHLFRPRAPFGHGDAAAHVLENAPAGYYAFIIRGGDGGVGRLTNGSAASHGGAGGMVMGYFRLDSPQTLYIEVGSAGAGGVVATQENAAHFGGGNNSNSGGQGGGATIISTSSVRGAGISSANIIAVAGGGGGGGGSNGATTHVNNNGGNAGGAGGGTGAQANPILNGSASGQAGTTATANGLASGGFQSGNPANRLKSTATPGGTSSSNGGGGGGASAGGVGGAPSGQTTPAGRTGSHLQGGHAGSSSNGTNFGSGGGGAGWFGGGGGGNNATWHGGGGGGSSFARSDVNALSNELLGSEHFADLVALQTYALSTARYAQGEPPRVVVRENVRSVALQDIDIIQDYANAGWNGFAYIVYMGQVHPNESDNQALVVAPGTGLFGAPLNIPNTVGESSIDGTFRYTYLGFHNRSEVPVRIRIEYDPANSRMPNVDSNGVVTMGTGTSPNLRPPIIIRPFVANVNTSMFAISETNSLRNIYRNRANTGRIDFASANDHLTGLPFAGLVNNDGWIVLQPGQATGIDVATVGIGWVWMYGLPAMPTFTAGGISFGAGRHYNTWSNAAAQLHWQGLNNSAIIPHIPGTTRGDNIDRFDTVLGREAARRRQNGLPPLELSLAFRITVEQLAA